MPAFPAASLDVVVTSPPYNLGIRYRSYADRLPRQRYLDWTGAWVARDRALASARRLAVPQRRRQAHRSVDGHRHRPGRPAAPAPAEHLALDQVHRHRPRQRRRRRGPGARPRRWGTTSRSTAGASSTTATSSSFSSRPLAGSSWTGWRWASPTRTRRTSRAGRPLAEARVAAGNTWFMPYDTIQSRDKDRPHPATFPPRLPEYCLRLHGLERGQDRRRSVPRTRQHRRRLRDTGCRLRRD